MPALNFQKQFAGAVESGEKRQTVRSMRKRPIREGDRLYLYTGMRTKSCRKLKETECQLVQTVWIERDALMVDDEMATPKEREGFAHSDGFDTWEALAQWFEQTHGLPFEGQVIHWP